MSYRTAFAALMLAAIAAAPAAGQMGGVINDSTFAYYNQGNAPVGETDDTAPGESIFYAANHDPAITYNWWFYRVAGDAVQRPFGTYTKSDGFTISGTSNYPEFSGQTATYNWTEIGPTGTRFTAVYTTTVSGTISNMNQAQLAQTFQINNPNATALDIVLFNAARLSPGGVSSGAVSGTGNVDSIDVADGAFNTMFSAVGASAYQLGAYTDLYGTPALDLNNTVASYSGTTYPFGTYEWSLVVPGNASVTISSSLDAFVAVPEPGSLLFVGTAAGAAMGFGRRRRCA